MSLDFPAVTFFSFDTSELADPSGQRHLPNGSFAFNKILGSGFTSGLDLSVRINTTSSDITHPSDVKAVIFRNDTGRVGIANMKVFNRLHDALNPDLAILQFQTSGIWQPNPTWPSGIHEQFPKQVPEFSNLKRQDGTEILLDTDDENVSEYMYINLVASSDHPLGLYGAGNNGEINISVIFDYFNIPSGT